MGKKQEYKLKNEEYLRELSQKEGIKKLPNGILYEVIKEGSGEGKVTERSIVTCHYRGSLINGNVFDDSWQRGIPEAFRVNELITGFQTALCAMHKGDIGVFISHIKRVMEQNAMVISLLFPRWFLR